MEVQKFLEGLQTKKPGKQIMNYIVDSLDDYYLAIYTVEQFRGTEEVFCDCLGWDIKLYEAMKASFPPSITAGWQVLLYCVAHNIELFDQEEKKEARRMGEDNNDLIIRSFSFIYDRALEKCISGWHIPGSLLELVFNGELDARKNFINLKNSNN